MTEELHSLRGLAWILGVPLQRLEALAQNPNRHYNPFEKRKPGKAPRLIDNPDENLKEVQRLIRRRFLCNRSLDESVRACVKGGSPYKNALVHTNQRNLARVDVKKCFPSITNTMVFRLLRSIGFGPKPASLLTQLSTWRGHLPQGAPTSDMLANLYLTPIDRRANELSASLHLNNSRCMDDIALSGDGRTREAIAEIIKAVLGLGLAVRHKKTKNAGARKPHELTGYEVTGPRGPKVSKKKIQEIRTAVHKAVQAHQLGKPIGRELRSIRGSLTYLSPTNPGAVRRLTAQLAAAGISLVVGPAPTQLNVAS